jgi:ABC-type glycerol-3-phosphate transport system permease component
LLLWVVAWSFHPLTRFTSQRPLTCVPDSLTAINAERNFNRLRLFEMRGYLSYLIGVYVVILSQFFTP